MASIDARADWEARIGLRKGGEGATAPSLPFPSRVTAVAGAGQVTLRWDPVPGAIGYLIQEGDSPEGPFRAIDHGGGDVLAVPAPPYADTTGEPGRERWYVISSLSAVEQRETELSPPVAATPGDVHAEPLTVRVDVSSVAGSLRRVWHMVGSEHLSQLGYEEETGGIAIGRDFAAALRQAHDELGVDLVRAHAILHDELGIYREEDGEPHYDFTAVDRVYDELLELGLRPVVELSFMPRDLASAPDDTVFHYRGIISPPRDWDRWGELNRRLAEHLVGRYGIDEVERWGFEVWNEANLDVFWSGSKEQYFRLYEEAARAIKSVDERLVVGGPSTAAAGWVADFLDFVIASGSPLDFFSTHTYGNVPLNLRPALEARGLGHVQIWWTEWGVTPTHFAGVTDSAFGAPFVLHGMKRAQDSADALAYWVVSDHFEELGRPGRLLHGGFGLLTVGNLRKPRYWALALAEQLADELVDVEIAGDGAGSLVDGWGSRHRDGRVDVLLWNGTLDHSKLGGDPLLDRAVRLRIDGLRAATYGASVARVDNKHSNIALAVGDTDWPDEASWSRLRKADRLEEEPLGDLAPEAGSLELELNLPMPGVAGLRLEPR